MAVQTTGQALQREHTSHFLDIQACLHPAHTIQYSTMNNEYRQLQSMIFLSSIQWLLTVVAGGTKE